MQSNSFIFSSKKLGFLVLPFLVWQTTELFFLPIDTFTFRAWETTSINEIQSIPGVFYPNQDFTKIEAGDLDRFRIKRKSVHWVTDEFGFRNRTSQDAHTKKYDVVLIGDSHFAGSYISQENTLTEVLARKCNCSVYNFSKGLPGNIVGFFNSKRFQDHPPKTIVFEIRRGDVEAMTLPKLKTCNTGPEENGFALNCITPSFFHKIIAQMPISWQITADRFFKQPLLQFLKSRTGLYIREVASYLRTRKWSSEKELVNIPDPIPRTNDKSRNEQIEFAFHKLISYQKTANARGIRFIFLFMPSMNREFDSLITLLNRVGVETIGFLPSYRHEWNLKDIQSWFHKEDYHWLEGSIDETAKLISERLTKKEFPAEVVTRE